MRTNLIRGILAIAVIFAVSGPAFAQSIVRGKVLDAQGKPIEGAIVTIAGTEGSTERGGAGAFSMCATSVSAVLAAANGTRPVASWYITTPSEYTSLRPSSSAPDTCSGLM